MKTVKEHNAERLAAKNPQRTKGLGVLCPRCGKGELYDTWPGTLLMSNPPKISVACNKCDYMGSVFA